MPKTDDDKLGVLSAYEKGELKSVATTAELAKFTAYHQLGRFVVAFQRLEGAVNDLLVLLGKVCINPGQV